MSVMTAIGFLSIGAIIGLVSYLLFKKRGVRFLASVIIAAISALVGGVIAELTGLSGTGYYAAISSFFVLLTFNVFRTPKEPVFE